MYVEAYDRCVAEEKGRVYTAPPEDCRKQKCDGRCDKRHAKDIPLESILTGPFQMMPADEVEETGSASQPHGGGGGSGSKAARRASRSSSSSSSSAPPAAAATRRLILPCGARQEALATLSRDTPRFGAATL